MVNAKDSIYGLFFTLGSVGIILAMNHFREIQNRKKNVVKEEKFEKETEAAATADTGGDDAQEAETVFDTLVGVEDDVNKKEKEIRKLENQMNHNVKKGKGKKNRRHNNNTNEASNAPATASILASASSNQAPADASDPDPFKLGEVYKFRSLGRLRSVFVSKRGVPRQGLLVPSVRAFIQIENHVSRFSIEGLDQFSHVWIVFLFSRNTNAKSSNEWIEKAQSFQSRVTPPVLGGKKEGVFATRSPHRPNPIGLTLAKLEKIDIEQRRVYVRGIDICDGTPILDIKPYHPSDRPTLDDEIRYPLWIEENTKKLMENNYENSNALKVIFTEEADMKFKELCKNQPTPFYGNEVDLFRKAVEEVLSLDVRAIHQNRGKVEPDVAHYINMAGYKFCMYFDEVGKVTVKNVEISPMGLGDLEEEENDTENKVEVSNE